VYDLDANATGSDPHVLIQPETDFEKFQSLRHILVDVNYEEPSFPFTLCAVPDTYSHKSVAGKPTVRVDHVAPAEEGVLATISASKLTSFMLPSSGVCFCSYLCGSKIARYISHDSTNRTKRRIEVYTWTRSAGSVVRFQTIITDHPFSERVCDFYQRFFQQPCTNNVKISRSISDFYQSQCCYIVAGTVFLFMSSKPAIVVVPTTRRFFNHSGGGRTKEVTISESSLPYSVVRATFASHSRHEEVTLDLPFPTT